MQDKKLIVVGAGPMGLAAAFHAARAGYDVDVIEADDRVGGMAAHFDFDGLSLERFYHFCCLSDADTLELLNLLGKPDAMKWVATTMGYYIDGKLEKWGEPFALLSSSKMGLIGKVRYGLQMFLSTKRSDWRKLDSISARDWFEAWSGKSVYDRFWRPLMELKFYEYADRISAAWMWQRIKRLGNSRKSLFEERLGYIEGGSETLMNGLADAIRAQGGRIHLSARASRFLVNDGQVAGVECADGRKFGASRVISTIATPYVAELLRDQSEDLQEWYRRIENIGCVCVVLKLDRNVTKHFWVNISDKRFEIPGIVEFSNLRPFDETIVYVPFYMPSTNEKFGRPDEVFVQESLACIRAINPGITEANVLASHVGRLKHAQPVYDTGFAAKVPPIETPIKGLQIADTCYYYPEDRGVSESARLAKQMVADLSKKEVQ